MESKEKILNKRMANIMVNNMKTVVDNKKDLSFDEKEKLKKDIVKYNSQIFSWFFGNYP